MSLISWVGRLFGMAPAPVPPPAPVVRPAPPPPPPIPEWPTSDARTVLAMTAWMEDRSGGVTGMQAVMNVVVNRAQNPRWWGNTIYSVCLKPYQFSCWNDNARSQLDLCIVAMKSGGADNEWNEAYNLAQAALDNLLPDLTYNADSYFAGSLKMPPIWANTAHYCGSIGGNRYYRVYLPPPSP